MCMCLNVSIQLKVREEGGDVIFSEPSYSSDTIIWQREKQRGRKAWGETERIQRGGGEDKEPVRNLNRQKIEGERKR